MYISQKPKQCDNCDQLKTRLQEQEEAYALKIRELEVCIRDLTAEKEALQKKVTNQRRSSEEFTSRVQQMVQKLETEQRAHKQETRTEKPRETENFFNMVKRFFTEHEALKEHAQNCLRDLHQLQRYFQVWFSAGIFIVLFTYCTKFSSHRSIIKLCYYVTSSYTHVLPSSFSK